MQEPRAKEEMKQTEAETQSHPVQESEERKEQAEPEEPASTT